MGSWPKRGQREGKQVIRGSEAPEESLHTFKSSIIFDLVKERPSAPLVKGLLTQHWRSYQLKLRGPGLDSIKCQKRSSGDEKLRLETGELRFQSSKDSSRILRRTTR